MFVTSAGYEKAMRDVLSDPGDCSVAVAFWGDGAEKLITSKRNGSIRIICNLRSGATNPSVVETLQGVPGVEIKQHHKLHAKVLISTSRVLIGSANVSANGLNFESDELKGWEEAGTVVNDQAQIRAANIWFEELWGKASPIKPGDIAKARDLWRRRRGSRPHLGKHPTKGRPFSFQEFSKPELRDRVYLVLYEGSDLSRSEARGLDAAKQEGNNRSLLAFANWDDLPKGMHFIDVECDRNKKKYKCSSKAWVRVSELDRVSGGSTLQIVKPLKQVERYEFSRATAVEIEKWLKSAANFEKIWDSPKAIGDESGKYIALSDALEVTRKGAARRRRTA